METSAQERCTQPFPLRKTVSMDLFSCFQGIFPMLIGMPLTHQFLAQKLDVRHVHRWRLSRLYCLGECSSYLFFVESILLLTSSPTLPYHQSICFFLSQRCYNSFLLEGMTSNLSFCALNSPIESTFMSKQSLNSEKL